MKSKAPSDDLKIVHEFNAPRSLVFRAFTNAEALGQWWGPAECNNSVLSLDFRTGGTFLYKMEMDGHVNYGRFLFGEIRPDELLEFTNAFADSEGNIIRAPFDIQLPMEIHYRLIFTERGGKTIITVTAKPVRATDEEIQIFKSINSDVEKGYGAMFNKLSIYLAKAE